MITKLFYRLVPSLNCVAGFALISKLIPVDIGMTVGASLTDVFKNQVRMAAHTRSRLVHASQWIMGLRIMVELGFGANGTPTNCRMTVLARNV